MSFDISEFEFIYECGYPTFRQIWIKNNLPNLPNYDLRSDVVRSTTSGDYYLTLFVDPNNYSPVSEGGSNFISAGKSSILNVALKRKGFNAKFFYTEANLYQVVRLIAIQALKTKELITVVDFVSPEPEDYFNGYTVRSGLFIDVKSDTGSIQINYPTQSYVVPKQQLFPGSFDAVFKERDHRWM